MQEIEKLLGYIKTQSEKECREIAQNASNECERLRAEGSKNEQAAYWDYINKGSIDIESRTQQLNALATEQADKMISDMQQEMLDRVLALTARKLSALPTRAYNDILTKLGIEHGLRPEFLVEQFRDDLTPSVTKALFD